MVSSYNQLVTVFTQYEDVWLSTWLSQTEACMKLLNTTLLAQDETSGKVIVYADPRYIAYFKIFPCQVVLLTVCNLSIFQY